MLAALCSQCIDCCHEVVERRFFRGGQRSDVFIPGWVIQLVIVDGWIQGALAVLLMVYP
jgi:hypothetical protein